MNKELIFLTWAPETSVWSRWAKPVPFAYLDSATPIADAHEPPRADGWPTTHPLPFGRGEGSVPSQGVNGLNVVGGNCLPEPVWETDWVPAIETRSALVLDLPGAEGVLRGLELAARGYRPVPLYNAVPLPGGEPPLDPLTSRPVAAVQVLPILHALKTGATILGQIDLPPDAPPVFLLDAHRRGAGRKMLPDEFDNRSVCFTTDFPSANFLAAQHIARVVLVQPSGQQPQLDLAHVLRRWQQSGIAIQLKRLDVPGPSVPCEVARPSWFGAMFQRALSMVGLHYGEAGGFGGWVTSSSAGG